MPLSFVDLVVVSGAKGDEVIQVGWSVVVPFSNMRCAATLWVAGIRQPLAVEFPGTSVDGCGAPAPSTTAVHGLNSSPLGVGSGPVFAANVYWHAGVV